VSGAACKAEVGAIVDGAMAADTVEHPSAVVVKFQRTSRLERSSKVASAGAPARIIAMNLLPAERT
jgi:hypothetical protein